VTATPALSVQTYSVRDDLGARTAETFGRLRALGFQNVEPHDILTDTAGLARELETAGLRAPTAHASVLRHGASAVVDAARRLGIGTVFVPWADPKVFRSREGIRALAEEINAAARLAGDHGVSLGYHNHEFEFQTQIDGVAAWEILVDEFDDDVVVELDTYWASVGGADVFELIPRRSTRIRALHVNDEPPEPDDPPTLGVPVVGRLDEVVAVASGHVELIVVEIVVDGDVFPALERNAGFFQEVLER